MIDHEEDLVELDLSACMIELWSLRYVKTDFCFLLNSDLKAIFYHVLYVSKKNSKHESCSCLENFGSSFSFIGPIDHDIWPFS